MGMQSKKSEISLDGKQDLDLSYEPNMFQNRFNAQNGSKELFKNAVTGHNNVHVERGKVLKCFHGVVERTSPGPDGRFLEVAFLKTVLNN